MVTIEGHEMLGFTVGSTSFAKEFAAPKVEELKMAIHDANNEGY